MTVERRRFYRIDDEVSLSMEPIEDAEADARLKHFLENQHAFSMRNNFNLQIEQHIADFNLISRKMPELGRYLGVLQAQIDAIGERQTRDDCSAKLINKPVSLSAQGIAFPCDEAPAKGSLLELTLQLIPSGLLVVILARVIKMEANTSQAEGKNILSLDFEHIHEADREILIKYVHSKQMKSLASGQSQDS